MAIGSKPFKTLAFFLAWQMLLQPLIPFIAKALTGGPDQPEVHGFTPAGVSDMVDLFSGDFTYNIPLMDVGGYPLNISYHPVSGMDAEASWVGLGWSLNTGVVNRNMRGLPDDFDGDVVKKDFNTHVNWTVGVSGSFGAELFGIDRLGFTYGMGVNFNNYNGFGFEQTANFSISSGNKGKGPLTGSLGLNSSSNDGLTLSPSVSYSKKIHDKENGDVKMGGSLGLAINSRSGLKALTLGLSSENTQHQNDAGQFVDNDMSIGGGNGGSSISFATKTYTPQITMPMVNTSVTFSAKFGGTFFGIDGTYNLGGYYSEQRLAERHQEHRAYGYLHAEDGRDPFAMLDFNREKDGAYTMNTPGLPLTNFTYDVFSVSGQGVSGTFRPYRNDVGYVYDGFVNNQSDSYSLGLEFGTGNLAKAGFDASVNDVFTVTQKWISKNDAAANLGFNASVAGKPLYEPYNFKEAGEKSVDSDPGFYDKVGGDKAVRVQLTDNGGMDVGTGHALVGDNVYRDFTSGQLVRATRQRRNQCFSLLNMSEAKNYGLRKNLLTDRASIGATNSHIGEITVLRPDGVRYIYGLPVYNTYQEEASFNVSGRPVNCTEGTVTYQDVDASVENPNGLDHSYNSTKLPPYSHSFFLTAIVSPDYSDLTGDGPTDDDLGTYTIFNYKNITRDGAGNYTPYKWRVPLGDHAANFNEGLKSDKTDDQGNYLYGEKEVWYLDTIVTRNYVAKFTLEPRCDGYGVTDVKGVVGGIPMMKLARIDLYSKPDFVQNFSTGRAVPIKSVHFEYSYDLCPGVQNNSGSPIDVDGNNPGVTHKGNVNTNKGKLTLTKIYFTYGSSGRGRLSPYIFHYCNASNEGAAIHDAVDSLNPPYQLKAYDRWGNYKPNTGDCANPLSKPTPAEFPYVGQDSVEQAKYAAAWCMTSIDLPSGGTIKVSYESDDYAYVQNKKAGQMFKVVAIGKHPVSNSMPGGMANLLEDPNAFGGAMNNVLYVALPPNYSPANATEARAALLGDIKNLYFRFLVAIKGPSMSPEDAKYEFVSGYANILDFGLVKSSSGTFTHAWIELEPVSIGDRGLDGKLRSGDVNPISRTAWQFGRIHLPRWVFGDETDQAGSTGITDVINAIANSSFAKNLSTLVDGVNVSIREKDYGKRVVLNKCWIRLQNPIGKKLGGGSRVRKITMVDNWDRMGKTGGQADYGQEYSYTTREDLGGGNFREISSGVAAYEPTAGNDENPFRQPVYVGDENDKVSKADKILAPDEDHYLESPFGESFFPAPTVGYSKVTVKNLTRTVPDPVTNKPNVVVTRHATGSVVHEFYTARDFPTITQQTDLCTMPKKTNPILSLFKVSVKDYMTVSQGYVVILNDMHGKQKAQWVYAEGQDKPISGVEYKYQSNGNRLVSEVSVVGPDGTLGTAPVGVDQDCIVDFREQSTTSISGGANGNLAGFLASIFPIVVPSILPSWSKEKTRFRSAVVTKIISKSGILSETVAHDAGSSVSTENLVYDRETGEVLLSRTKNEFRQPIYSFTYPAHWAYDGMGQAYKNINANVAANFGVDGSASVPKDVFVVGDELGLGTSGVPAWILKVTSSKIFAVNRDGAPVTGSYPWIKVVRSGRRNQQTTPIGKIVSLEYPFVTPSMISPGKRVGTLSGTSMSQVNAVTAVDLGIARGGMNPASGSPPILNPTQTSGILDADATEFDDTWQMQCGQSLLLRKDTCICDSMTTESRDFVSLLNRLLSKDSVLGTSLVLSPNSIYSPDYFSPLLASYFADSTTLCWSATYSGTLLNARIYSLQDSSSSCGLTLNGLKDWHSVLNKGGRFENIKAYHGSPASANPSGGTGTVSISGTVYYDQNGNITKDAKEVGLSGWTVTLCKDGKPVPQTTVTNANGNYSYSNLPPGRYGVCVTLQPGWIRTTADPLDSCLSGGTNASGKLIGVARTTDHAKASTQPCLCDNPQGDGAQPCNVSPGPVPLQCDSVLMFTVDYVYGSPAQRITLTGTTTCWPMADCRKELDGGTVQCGKIAGDIINPYLHGFRGNWRTLRSHKYLTNRLPVDVTGASNIRRDGIYATFEPFWTYKSPLFNATPDKNKRWTWTTVVTKYNLLGFEVENRDALERYSSALYGYNYALPTAVASNAKYTQIGFDGFEDYNLLGATCALPHFNFFDFRDYRTNATSHTGVYSLRLFPGQAVSLVRDIPPPRRLIKNVLTVPYKLQDVDCIGIFSPDTGTYVLSAWVKEETGIPATGYANVSLNVSIAGNSGAGFTMHPKGSVIEGWQKIEETFVVKPGATSFKVTLNPGMAIGYFDDIRIHPYNGNMKTYVYDPWSFRLMAQLDENNYGTLYEYDEQGQLVRTKKETERGMVMTQEARSSNRKSQK